MNGGHAAGSPPEKQPDAELGTSPARLPHRVGKSRVHDDTALHSHAHIRAPGSPQTLLHVLGAALFASGFLLTRTELVDSSTCTDVPVDSSSTCATAATCETACWSPSLTKAVVLLIDGLRWDVAAGTARSAAPHRSLALPSLQNLSSDPGRSTILARFVADPPTTTQQRLKGLLTGAAPGTCISALVTSCGLC